MRIKETGFRLFWVFDAVVPFSLLIGRTNPLFVPCPVNFPPRPVSFAKTGTFRNLVRNLGAPTVGGPVFGPGPEFPEEVCPANFCGTEPGRQSAVVPARGPPPKKP